MTDERKSIADYVAEKGVTLRVTRGPEFTRDADGWEHNAYRVQLSYEGRKFTTSYMMGTAHKYEPDVAMVLDSLVSDASAYRDAQDFEDFAATSGYDADSRKAEKIYRDCGKIAGKLEKLLGTEELDYLTSEVERL